MNDDERIFQTIIDTCTKMFGDKFTYDENDYRVNLTISAKPFDVAFEIKVKTEPKVVLFMSKLPFSTDEDSVSDYILKVIQINYDELLIGNFDYSLDTKKTVFRMDMPYRESLISSELISNYIQVMYSTIVTFQADLYEASQINKKK